MSKILDMFNSSRYNFDRPATNTVQHASIDGSRLNIDGAPTPTRPINHGSFDGSRLNIDGVPRRPATINHGYFDGSNLNID
jgi:hypothetical protein